MVKIQDLGDGNMDVEEVRKNGKQIRFNEAADIADNAAKVVNGYRNMAEVKANWETIFAKIQTKNFNQPNQALVMLFDNHKTYAFAFVGNHPMIENMWRAWMYTMLPVATTYWIVEID